MDRWLLTLTMLGLLGAGAALAGFADFEDPAAHDAPLAAAIDHDSGWRRTTRGWEHESAWIDPYDQQIPPGRRIHPAVVGALQLLAAVGALVLFDRPQAVNPSR